MKAFLSACAIAIVVAIIAVYALDAWQTPADVTFSSPESVRL